jgi:hypothetical protein
MAKARDDDRIMTDPALEARGCRWITVPGVVDPRGRINFLQLGKDLDFEPKRMSWLRQNGRHIGRDSRLVMFAGYGRCQVHLDDGMVKETVTLDHPAKALYIGAGVSYELDGFAPQTAIIVLASGSEDERRPA